MTAHMKIVTAVVALFFATNALADAEQWSFQSRHENNRSLDIASVSDTHGENTLSVYCNNGKMTAMLSAGPNGPGFNRSKWIYIGIDFDNGETWNKMWRVSGLNGMAQLKPMATMKLAQHLTAGDEVTMRVPGYGGTEAFRFPLHGASEAITLVGTACGKNLY